MKSLASFLITLYQKYLSPFFSPCCRFYPSCSQYTKECICEHGVLKGVLYGIKRLLKCNPLFDGGVDPVPQKQPTK